MLSKYKMNDEEIAFIEEVCQNIASSSDEKDKQFREAQTSRAKELLLNVTNLLNLKPFSSYYIDITLNEIVFIYEDERPFLFLDKDYMEKYRHIKPLNGIKSLDDDLYECTYLMIKCIVYDEVDQKIQDMVISFILEMATEEETVKDTVCP